jgi:hypothetical protein
MLIDLDELVAECPDPRSRKYIRESVQCYKAGAYRAAVVACWIAVAFDLVDKIRELAAAGEPMAIEAIGTFDRARQNNNIAGALAFEKDLLTLARDKFQFISHIEFIDLERLVQDRNRCAHPSHVSDTEVFEATPELARLHIVNATRYVLSQPAAQGKQALERLIAELDSNFFPNKLRTTVVLLRASALAKPRESLLRSYLSILLKRLMKEPGLGWETSNRASNALFALSEIHPEPWKRLVREILATVIPNLQKDDELLCAAQFVGSKRGSELGTFLGEADRLRMVTFVENLPHEHFDSVELLLSDEAYPLYRAALSRIKRASADDVFESMFFDVPEAVIGRMLDFYAMSHNFARANEVAKKLRLGLNDSYKPSEHLARLATIAGKNDQVAKSAGFGPLVKEFVKSKFTEKAQAEVILREAGLNELADEL